MRDETKTLLTALGSVVSTADLSGLGLSPEEVQAMVAGGQLVRIRRSAFVEGEVWRAATSWERDELRIRAVLRSLGPGAPVAPSHQSSLVLQQIAVYGVDNRVHVCRTDGGRSREDATLVTHRRVPEAFIRERDIGPCVSPALACLQVTVAFGVEAGLVSADAALREGRATRAELEEALGAVRGSRRRSAAARVVELATPLSESVGESRTRWGLLMLGLPEPEQQAEIWDRQGVFVARVDFLFRRAGVIVEFDGMLKYTEPHVLRREKLREDRLRELGYEVVRLTWADLADLALVNRRLQAAFTRSRLRRAGAS